MLSVTNKSFMLSIIMLNVVMLSVVMLNALAPNDIQHYNILKNYSCINSMIVFSITMLIMLGVINLSVPFIYCCAECRYTSSKILMVFSLMLLYDFLHRIHQTSKEY
jgi:hypothetical protein